MNEGKFWCLAGVSDGALQQGLQQLLTSGARTEARIVAHLAEVDARKLHLSMGASSLFDYCLSRLKLSNNEAFHRITAARLARRFPIIFELLERRDVHLTAVCMLRDHLTDENHRELLAEVTHKTKLQIEELLARRFLGAEVSMQATPSRGFEPLAGGDFRLQLVVSPELRRKLELARDLMSHANQSGDLSVVVERAVDLLIAKLQSRRFAQTKSEPEGRGHAEVRGPKILKSTSGFRLAHRTPERSRAEAALPHPASPESAHLQSATSRHAQEAGIATASGAPTASVPPAASATPTETEAVSATGAETGTETETKTETETGTVRASPTATETGEAAACGETEAVRSLPLSTLRPRRAHLPNGVRRAVVSRDGERCSFVGLDGHRCEARAFLQFHHQRAWAVGGEDSVENLRVVCRAHNRLLAERELGTERIAQAIQQARQRR